MMHRALPLKSWSCVFVIASAIGIVLTGCSHTPTPPAPVEDRSSLIQPEKQNSFKEAKPTQPVVSAAPAKREKEAGNPSTRQQSTESQSSTAKSSDAKAQSQKKEKEESEAVASPLVNDDGPIQSQTTQQQPGLQPQPQPQAQSQNQSPVPVQPQGTGATNATANPVALPPISWVWPSDLPVAQGFSEARKGIDFAGAAGQPVRSVANGVATYVGNSLRGYGQMLVVKHDQGFISVYANNSKILVKEGQKIERAQKIAETGHADGSDIALHFEIRQQGKPLDPSSLFPPRNPN